MSQSLSASFIRQQQLRLEQLQDEILGVSANQEEPEDHETADVQDTGDEGADEARRGIEDALDANARVRLGAIRRALEKIEEGSYGQSDESGDPIPPQRLEAVPEAVLTVEEESLRERYPQADEPTRAH